MKIILKEYANDLIKWSEELKASKVLKAPIDYMKSVTLKSGKQFYRSHYEMVFTFFKMYCGSISKTNFDLANENVISFRESRWFESCYNGGLTYLKQAKQIYKNIYGYDFKQFYPSLMSSKKFIIPTDEGTEQILSMMPQKLKFGLYRCKISVGDDWNEADFIQDHFKMVFKYSPDSIYTHIELNFIRLYFPDVSIELIQDGTPNALIYSKFITGYDIFGFWFARICDLRKEQPKNPLIKHFSSKFWGHLIEFSSFQMSEEELENNPEIRFGENGTHEMIDEIYRSDGSVLYEISPKNKKYKNQIRIKPFLIAEARVRCAQIALSDPDHVVRIQTDGVIFDRPINSNPNAPFKANFDGLIPEEKTTGSFYFHHVNLYRRLENPDDEEYISKIVESYNIKLR
jgi:hypothetical protein